MTLVTTVMESSEHGLGIMVTNSTQSRVEQALSVTVSKTEPAHKTLLNWLPGLPDTPLVTSEVL